MPRAPSPLARFHPEVRRWFRETLGAPSAPQQAGWPAIASGANTLILAPTGTGKTLAAFLWELNALIEDGVRAPLANAVQILYISPLKALGNDVHRNLERPLAELRERFAAKELAFPEIRVAVRTGDTPSSARQRMLRKAPHVLITTPESLHIMLTSQRGRGMFSGVRAVIIDEIHALAGTKRGAHLALTLERLERLTERPPQRIGLSATQRPLEEIARFLGGLQAREVNASPKFRPVTIVDCGLVKEIELTVESPVEDIGHVGGTVWPMVAALVARRLAESRTTLIFVNNRGQAERMAARVNAVAGSEVALPYHGSLSKERRLALESQLKAGKLRALVTTSALELGIDIGSVDLVIQLQSPKRVSTGLQRVGRAGHTLAAVSRGVFVPTFRDDAVELLAVVDAMRDGDVEPTRVVQNALDVLAQVLVAIIAIDDGWTSAALFTLVRQAYPYFELTRSAFEEVLEMLAGKYPADVAAELDARVAWDRSTDELSAARGSRLVAVTSGGTIPDRGLYAVVLADRTRLGELDEEFVHETRVGDVFQLGSSTWRVQAIEHDRVIVSPAPGAPARMPFWHGEFGARATHLAPRVGVVRRALDAVRDDAAVAKLAGEYHCDDRTIRALADYMHEQRAATRELPDDRHLVVEQFRDETGAVRLVLHAPFGGRVNAPWAMALAQRYREWLESHATAGGVRPGAAPTVEVQTTDDGIMLRLPSLSGWAPVDLLRGMTPEEAEGRVIEEVGGSSLFGARFRMNAARALLLPRGNPRKRMPLWLQRLKAQDLLATVREYPSFPILVETYRDVLRDAFDMPGLGAVLQRLANGEISISSVTLEAPSPFASSLQFGFVMEWMYGDDAPRAERRAAMLSLDRTLLDELLGSEGADEGTIASLEQVLAVRRGTAPELRARTADELAVLIDRGGDLTLDELRERIEHTPAEPLRDGPLAELLERGRAVGVALPDDSSAPRIILVENWPRYAAAFGAAVETVLVGPALRPTAADVALPEPFRTAALAPRAARREILLRWSALAGPFTIADAVARYGFAPDWVERRLAEWVQAGRLVRGRFGTSGMRWCSRRLLEIARRRELARLRREVEAVGMPAFVDFLQRWQHLHPATRLTGDDATRSMMEQLAGVARPVEAWDRDYLPLRAVAWNRDDVSRLGQAGELTWIAGHSGKATDGTARVTNARFIWRGTGRLWISAAPDEALLASLDADAAAVRQTLAYEGASFFEDIVSSTALAPNAVRDALRTLAAAGLVTNDSLDALRAVARWRVMPPKTALEDPARWLPADFARSRPVVQRRPNLRRLPKWRPPAPGETEQTGWTGRWALVHTPRVLGPERGEDAAAVEIARQWLARYGVVSRDWWRRERPSVAWRAIYHELRRLELRGEVRRGYFVRGLAGAQFALPDAVERLRASIDDAAPVVMAASDPANAWSLPGVREDSPGAPGRARGSGALTVTVRGSVVIVAEGRGHRWRIRADAPDETVAAAAAALAAHLVRRRSRPRDVILETIDGERATLSRWVGALTAAGFRRGSAGLRFYATDAGH